jgi:hypothetical protein
MNHGHRLFDVGCGGEMGESDEPADDRDRIDLGDPTSVGLWTLSLGVSEAQLRRAVAAVGSRADEVREYLQGRG